MFRAVSGSTSCRSRSIWRKEIFIAAALSLAAPLAAKGAEANDPLRLVPPSANLIVKIDHPRAISDLAIKLASRPELEGFRGYRDYFESTNYLLLRQLVDHFEHELGSRWADLLDELAGDGIVLAVKVEKKGPGQALVIVQGRDAKLMAKFFQKALDVVGQEQAREGIHSSYAKDTYRGIETLGRDADNIHSALLGSALVYSNSLETLHAAIDLYLDPSKESLLKSREFIEAKPLVPTDALVWSWVSLDFVHRSDELKPLYTLPANFFPFQVLFGGLTDSIRRSSCVVAAIREDHGTATLSIRLPGGTKGMHDVAHAHAPPEGELGALPLLEPESVLFSSSYYLDLSTFWKQRAALLPPDQLAKAEEFNEKSKVYLYGTQFSKFLEMAGTRQRFVVVQQDDHGYAVKPSARQPAFALVLELRDPEAFAKAIDGPLGGAAFLAGLKAPMNRFEEQHGNSKIIGYRFIENDGNKELGDGILFNFTPSHARVGNQYIFCSTVELARKMVDLLEKEPKPTKSTASDGVILHSQLSFEGISNYLGGTKKQLVTQNMLQQGNSPSDAEKEISLFLGMLDHLGHIEATTRYLPDQYQFDLKIVP